MKQKHLILSLLMLATFLAACSPGHLGTNVIAFLRDGHLWTIDPNGANALDTVGQDTPVIGYNWSPNHQLLAFRALDPSFAKTSAAKQLESNLITGQIGDVSSTVNTVGVDGGTPISVAFSNPDIRYSATIWNNIGTRLLYRQTPKLLPANPVANIWWVSQNDQPGGIAIKSLPGSYSIPSLSYTSQTAIGNSNEGLFTTTQAGTNQSFLSHAPLPGHPLPAPLERILWQPGGHQDTSFLYALPATAPVGANSNATSPLTIQLLLATVDGQKTMLASCTCTQFAWSPDGKALLYSTDTSYTILNLADHSTFTVNNANGSVPYWSPDGQFLLLDGVHTLILVSMIAKQQTLLLSDNIVAPSPPTTEPATNTLLQPVPNNIWAADSRHFLFLTHDRLRWQNGTLSSGKGLYTAAIDSNGHPQGTPTIVDKGDITQPGWTYQDPNTSFLY